MPPGALADFLRRGKTTKLAVPPTVGHVHVTAQPEIAVAAVVAHWAENAERVTAFAPPLVRSHGRARVVSLGREWTLPRTELLP